MPEPSSGRAGLQIPDNFDPLIHCGAKSRNKDKICMKPAGEGTPHLREGRCYLHGGLTPIVKDGSESKIYGRRRPQALKVRLADRIDELMHSEELLTLDRQIATLRAYIEREQELVGVQMDRYDDWMDDVRMAAITTGEMPPMPAGLFPSIDVSRVEALAKLVRTEYEMRFARKFSIPIEELGSIVVQIVNKFNKLADRYSLPQEAKSEFAAMLNDIRTSRPMEDVALMRAGRGALATNGRDPKALDAPED